MSESRLEKSGKLSEVPFAELLRELQETEIDGSFRVTDGQSKIIVYLKRGKVVFAVSNLRKFRLGECAVRWNLLTSEKITSLNGVANDVELAKKLIETRTLDEDTVRRLQQYQIGEIVQTACLWTIGDWNFSPLARIVEGVESEIESSKILLETARKLPLELIVKRFVGQNDSFSTNYNAPKNLNLNSTEGYMLSRLNNVADVAEIKIAAGIPELETYRALYSLWLGGFLHRHHWKRTFSEEKIKEIIGAKLVKSGNLPPEAVAKVKVEEVAPKAEESSILDLPPEKTPEQIADEARRELTAYLVRAERAVTHYDLLDIPQTASIAQIKEAYFRLAKQYHPDKLHRESPETFKRIQNAFTALAQAYETLKDAKSRELYDFKLRRDGKITKSEESNEKQPRTHSEFFEAGLKLLERELFDQAIAYLGQAVHLSPNTPRYRAFYGKAMGQNPRFKHQAEAELQAAVRLSGNLSEFRVMLAEFYKNADMPKRAVGELQKILSLEPNNKAARALLESIQK